MFHKAKMPLHVRPILNCLSNTCQEIKLRRFQSVLISKLMYEGHGDPVNVVKRCEEEMERLDANSVLVKMLAAPVHPVDINIIEGKYPSKPELPAVPGTEGVGEIVQIGSAVSTLAIGDRVVPLTSMVGTWSSHVILHYDNILKIPKELGLVEASTLVVNPCSAYRMLKDFVKLEKGDVFIQNGANSACGQSVIQLGRIWGLKSVNVIRRRSNVNHLKNFLKGIGANVVLTEEEIRTTGLFKSKKMQRPKLALNCVGGNSATDVIRHLGHGGTIVTYGGMSKEPVTVATSPLIFNDISAKGFWMADWFKRNYKSPVHRAMLDEIIGYMIQKDLHGPLCKMVEFDNYKEALTNAMTIKGMVGLKYILDLKK